MGQKLFPPLRNYMNDSLRTDAFVRYDPETIASACIYLTARKLRIPLPRQPSWYSLFHVQEADIQDVCKRILRLYSRPKVCNVISVISIEWKKKIKKKNHPSIPVMCVKEDTCWRQPLCYYCFCSQVMLQFFTCDRSLSQLSVGPVVLCGRCSYLKGSIWICWIWDYLSCSWISHRLPFFLKRKLLA